MKILLDIAVVLVPVIGFWIIIRLYRRQAGKVSVRKYEDTDWQSFGF